MPADLMDDTYLRPCVCQILNGRVIQDRHAWDNESNYCPELLRK